MFRLPLQFSPPRIPPLKPTAEHAMKLKALFYLILLTLFTLLMPAAHAQSFSVIHAFTGSGGEGRLPFAGVTIRGNALYGTTSGNCGTVYQLAHAGSNWLLSTLAALPHNCDPHSRVVFGPDGHLYGTSSGGGTYYNGTVFKLTPQVGPCKDAACYWTVSDLHDFGSGTDGQQPGYGDLIWDQQDNIYNTTMGGGVSGYGTVYELRPSGNGYTESVLHSFSGPDGAYPFNGLVFDNKGNLFGTTCCGGGSNGFGNVFELTYVVGVGWTAHVIYNFQNASDGTVPIGGLIFDSDGNLYGTTSDGGSGGGTVFELSPSGNAWAFKLLYSFPGRGGLCGPSATLTMDGAGNLYGTTECGGIYNWGNVFKLTNTVNGWVYTSLHDFTGGTDGGSLFSTPAIGTDGTLYGTTVLGGDPNCTGSGYSGCGVVWMIKP